MILFLSVSVINSTRALSFKILKQRDSLPRKERADHASIYINTKFPAKQKAFLDFVLSHYVSEGVQELDQEKLAPLLLLKYHTYNEAEANLGEAREIGKAFSGFQKYLYEAVL